VVQLQGYVTTLVKEGQNSFVHKFSNEDSLPKIYQDLLGLSALHCQKSQQNQAILWRMVDERVKDLISASIISSRSLEDRLLNLQALLMYQIMRLFDGDIRQRANAERNFTHLESWTQQLHQNYAKSLNDVVWESPFQKWVLFESIRRTILMSVLLQSVYSVIRDGVCYLVPFLSALPMSQNAALWMMSEHSWWQTVTPPAVSLVTYAEYVDQWNDGKIVEIDIYGKILLVACNHANGSLSFVDT
jgi:hypothetical protein